MIEQKHFVLQFGRLPVPSCQLLSIIQLLPTGDGEGLLQFYELLHMLCHKVAQEKCFLPSSAYISTKTPTLTGNGIPHTQRALTFTLFDSHLQMGVAFLGREVAPGCYW